MTRCVTKIFKLLVCLTFTAAPQAGSTKELGENSNTYLKLIQIEPVELNFAFENDAKFLFESEDELKDFWIEHSRIVDTEAPRVNVNWEKENLVAIFWRSLDDVKRTPSISYYELNDKSLFLSSFINKMCFAIITDISPSLFFAVAKSKIDEEEQIQVERLEGMQNCYSQPAP